jgi:hypothetical protein
MSSFRATSATPLRTRRLLYGFATAASVFIASMAIIGVPASADEAPPPLVGLPVPSSAPATGTSVDGWTLTLSASNETRVALVPPPGAPPNELIVGGVFTATLRNTQGGRTPTPSGRIKVGYEVQCIPAGFIKAMKSKPGVEATEIANEDFKGADPSVNVTAFHVQVECVGQVLARSYAILTGTTNGTDTVVAYYGVYTPI